MPLRTFAQQARLRLHVDRLCGAAPAALRSWLISDAAWAKCDNLSALIDHPDLPEGFTRPSFYQTSFTTKGWQLACQQQRVKDDHKYVVRRTPKRKRLG